MKKTSFILMALVISAFAIMSSSCAKEKGCMDPDSINYNPDAEEDDGSCEYQGRIIFWYDETAAEYLIENDVISLKYYVDGELVGSSAASVYYSDAPECGQDGTVTVTKNLGKDKTKSFTYSVKDQDGIELWSGNVTFKSNTCTAIQLCV